MALASEDLNDHNKGKGWTTVLYRNGKPIHNAELYLLNAKLVNSYSWNENGYLSNVFNTLKNSFEQNHKKYTYADSLNYFSTYTRVKEFTDTAYEIKFLDKLYNNPLFDKEEYGNFEYYYQSLGDNEKVNEIRNKIKINKPQYLVLNESMDSFFELDEPNKKKDFIQHLLDSLKDKKGWEYQISDMAFYTAIDYVENKQFKEALELIPYFKDIALYNQLYYTITKKITSKDFDLNTEDPFISTLVNTITTVDKDSSLYKRDNLSTYYDAKKDRAYTPESRNRNLAMIYSKLNQTEKAIQIWKEIEDRNLFSYFYYGNFYFNDLLSVKQFDAALSLWEKIKSKGITIEVMNKTIDSLVTNGIISSEKYKDALTKINQKVELKNKKEIASRISKTPSPTFKLKDYDGNEFSLSDFKGKKIMIDFWATWCGPCIDSFEEMYKIQEYFKKEDPSIQFIFIQTMEGADNEKNIEKAKEIINKKNVKFFVLYDDASSFSKKYHINAIPSKVFIDTSGNFRYKSIGYANNYEGNLKKMKTIFQLMD